MMPPKRFFSLVPPALFLAVAMATASFAADVKIFVTNDVHGYVFEDGPGKRIGYALLQGRIEQARREGFETILLDAGDAFSGNALAQFDAGVGVAELIGRMGYRVLAPGNHAFDYNASSGNMKYYSDVLLKTAADFAPSLVASSLNTMTAEPLARVTDKPVVLIDESDFRLVVLGVLTPYARSASSPENTEGMYDFGLVEKDGEADHAATKRNLLDKAASALAEFNRPTDVVLVLSHIGFDDTEEYGHGEIRGSDLASIPNVDFVSDAHSHNHIAPTRIGSAWYGNNGRYLNRFTEITLTPAARTMEMIDYDHVKGAVEPSETVLTRLRELSDRLGLGEELFRVEGGWLSDAGCSEGSIPLGRFIARTMREVTGADLAIYNSGSIRSGLPEGWVTLGSLYDVVPFQNNLVTFTMTGREILDFFKKMPLGTTNPFPQFHGMTVHTVEKGAGVPLDVVGVRDAGGGVLDPEKDYTVAINSFMASGGDGYSFDLRDKRDHGDQMGLFARYLKEAEDPCPDSLRVNDALVIHPTREAAVSAFLAPAFRAHCVRVRIHPQSSDGEVPSPDVFADALNHERPVLVGGYWRDATHVVIPDQGLQDRFIRSVEIELPRADGEGELYPARVAGRFIELQAMLLEVLPNTEGKLPAAAPLVFADGGLADAVTLSYVHEDGEWRVKAGGAPGSAGLVDSGATMFDIASEGVLVGMDGKPVGLAFGEKLIGSSSWSGRAAAGSPILSAGDAAAQTAALRERLRSAALECRFVLRVNMEDGEDASGSENALYDDNGELLSGGAPAEIRATGFVTGARRLLVPVPLSPEAIRRIEAAAVTLPDGREINASFAGAFRDYMAVALDAEEDLPPGLAITEAPDGGDAPAPLRRYIHRVRVDYALARRRELVDGDRWQGTFQGFRNDPVVLTRTNEDDGHLAFDTAGNLVAVSLTPRLINSVDRARGTVLKASPGFRPLPFLREKLSGVDAFDPALIPMDEEAGRRLIDLGVEFQPLDANTSRLFRAERETRGGKIGVLVTHVYPGSVAERAGLREEDVLLRLSIEGRQEPMELSSDRSSLGYNIDMSFDSLRDSLRFMPPPWPSRDNIISELLTDAGTGRRVALDYMRGGETLRAEFTTEYGEPDYSGAKKQKFARLGLTAKAVTFEVARYFARADRSGVIVDRIVEGGKGAVAGLHKYLLITHVNGAAVSGLGDFARKIHAFEAGESPSVELTVDNFGKTSLIRME